VNLIDAYRYLAALAQQRHFGRAAAVCHITQPALSNAMRALEEHYGVAIVRRSRQYEGLTPEGEQVLASAHRVLHEQEALAQALAGSAERPRGRLVIATVPTASPIAARFAARLVQAQPGIAPQVQSLSSQDIEAGLERLAIDLGLGYVDRIAGSARLRPWPQYVEHYYVLQRSERSTATLRFGAPIRWADAAALPLCLLSPEMHNRVIVDAVFRRLGLALQPALETNSVLALLAAVQGSALAAVLPGALVSAVAGQGGLEARPLVDPEVRTPIGFMTAAATAGRPSRTLGAALALLQDAEWRAHAEAHSGSLDRSLHQAAE
jgi:DNA-binding transcriptional LysR family regulator